MLGSIFAIMGLNALACAAAAFSYSSDIPFSMSACYFSYSGVKFGYMVNAILI